MAVSEAPIQQTRQGPWFWSLYADRASLTYWNIARWPLRPKVDQDTPIAQVGSALAQLGSSDPGAEEIDPRQGGARLRHVWQVGKRLLRNRQARRHHRHRRGQPLVLKDDIPATTNARFAPHGRATGAAAFVPFTRIALDDILVRCTRNGRRLKRSTRPMRYQAPDALSGASPAATAAITSRPGSARPDSNTLGSTG